VLIIVALIIPIILTHYIFEEVFRYEEYRVSLFISGIMQSSALIVESNGVSQVVYIEGTELGKSLIEKIIDKSYIAKVINELEKTKERIRIEKFVIKIGGKSLVASLEVIKLGSLTIPRNYLALALILGLSGVLILVSLFVAFPLIPRTRIT